MAKALNVSVSVNADTSQAKAALQSLQAQLNQLSANSANLQIGIDPTAIQKASLAATELAAHLKQATNVDTGSLNFAKLNASITSSGKTIQSYGNELLKLGPQGKQAFSQLTQAIAQSEIPMNKMSALMGNFGTVLKNTIRWQLSSSLIHGFIGGIQKAFTYAQNLNESLNRIQIVTGKSNQEMALFAESANKAAKGLGTTTTSYTDASLIYYQQGIRDQKEIEARTNATIKMANVTGQTAEAVSNQMTAIWNNFAKGGGNLEYYADVITALGAATASSSEEISQGLSKFASIADTVGLSYENATAALATITATTRQSADTVGTGLRTLFARLQSLSLGETLEDGVNLTKYTKALQTVGVSAVDASGNLRAMDDILNDLGKQWNNLSDAQKTALAQTVGGIRQYTTLMALMENFDFYQENLDIAKNSQGTLEKQQEIYINSWQAAQKQVRASMEALWSDFINDQFFIKLNQNFAKFLSIVDNVVDGLGGLKGVLSGIAAISLKLFNDQAVKGLVSFGTNMKMLFTSPKKLQDQRDADIAQMSQRMLNITSTNNLTPEQQYQYDNMQTYINLQRDYAKNVSLMTPVQQMVAQATLTNLQATQTAYDQQIQKLYGTQEAVMDKSSSIVSAFSSSDKYSSLKDNSRSMYQNLVTKQNTGNYSFSRGDNALWLQGIAQGFISRDTKTGQYNINDKLFDRFFNQNAFSGFRTAMENNLATPLKEFNAQKDVLNDFAQSGSKNIDQLQASLEKAGMKDAKDFLNNFTPTSPEGMKQLQEALIDQFKTGNAKNLEKLSKSYGVDQKLLEDYQKVLGQKDVDEKEKARLEKQIADQQANAKQAVNPALQASETAQSIVNLGRAITSLIAAASSMNSLVDTIQKVKDGSIETGTAITSITTSLGQMLTMGALGFSSLMSVLVAIPGVGQAAAVAIAAIVTALSVLAPVAGEVYNKYFKKETETERIARLAEEADKAQERAQSAKQAYDELLSSHTNHQELLNTLKNLTKGTLEYRDALLQANTAARTTIDANNLVFGKDWKIDENGAYQISDEAWTKMEEAAMQNEEATARAASMAKVLSDTAYDENIGFQTSADDPWQIRKLLNSSVNTYLDWLENGNEGTYADWSKSWKKKGGAWHTIVTPELMDQWAVSRGFENFDQMFAQKRDEANSGATGVSNQAQKSLVGLLQDMAAQDETITPAEELAIDQMIGKYGTKATIKDYQEQALANSDKWQEYLTAKADNAQSARQTYLEAMYTDYYGRVAPTEKEMSTADMEAAIRALIVYDQFNTDFTDEVKNFTTKNTKGYKDYMKMSYSAIMAVRGAMTNANEYDLAMADYIESKAESIKTDFDEATRNAFTQAEIIRYNALADAFVDGTSGASLEVIEDATGKINAYSSTFGEQVGSFVEQTILTQWSNGQNTEFLDFLTGIDLSGTKLQSIANIRKKGTEKGVNTEGLISSIYESVGEGNLFKELYESESFAESLQTLQKEFAKTGEIGAASILDIADSSDELNELLENTSINAQGLADVLTAMEMGDINADDISSGLLKAFSSAGQLKSTLAEVLQYIKDFQKDPDVRDVGSFYSGLSKTATESISSGAYFNPAALQAIETMFGEETRHAFEQDVAKWLQDDSITYEELQKKITKKYSDIMEAMEQVQKYGDMGPLLAWEAKNNDALKQYLKVDKHGNIDFKEGFKDKFKTQEEFIDYLTTEAGLNEDYAKALATSLDSYSAIHSIWSKNALIEGIGYLGETDGASELTGGFLTGPGARAFYKQNASAIKDLSVKDMAEALGVTGDKMTEFTKAFGENGKIDNYQEFIDVLRGAGEQVLDLGKNFDFAKASLSDLDTALQKDGSSLQSYLKETGALKDGTLNIDKAAQALQQLGFSADQAHELINKMGADTKSGNKYYSELSTQIMDAYGSLKTYTRKSEEYHNWLNKQDDKTDTAEKFQQWSDWYKDQQERIAQIDDMAEAFKEVFNGEEGLSLKMVIEGDQGALTILNDNWAKWTSKSGKEVNLHFEQGFLDDVTTIQDLFNKLNDPKTGENFLDSLVGENGWTDILDDAGKITGRRTTVEVDASVNLKHGGQRLTNIQQLFTGTNGAEGIPMDVNINFIGPGGKSFGFGEDGSLILNDLLGTDIEDKSLQIPVTVIVLNDGGILTLLDDSNAIFSKDGKEIHLTFPQGFLNNVNNVKGLIDELQEHGDEIFSSLDESFFETDPATGQKIATVTLHFVPAPDDENNLLAQFKDKEGNPIPLDKDLNLSLHLFKDGQATTIDEFVSGLDGLEKELKIKITYWSADGTTQLYPDGQGGFQLTPPGGEEPSQSQPQSHNLPGITATVSSGKGPYAVSETRTLLSEYNGELQPANMYGLMKYLSDWDEKTSGTFSGEGPQMEEKTVSQAFIDAIGEKTGLTAKDLHDGFSNYVEALDETTKTAYEQALDDYEKNGIGASKESREVLGKIYQDFLTNYLEDLISGQEPPQSEEKSKQSYKTKGKNLSYNKETLDNGDQQATIQINDKAIAQQLQGVADDTEITLNVNGEEITGIIQQVDKESVTIDVTGKDVGLQSIIDSVPDSVTVTVNFVEGTTVDMSSGSGAMGFNNASIPGFAGGRHLNNDYQGVAETGELGPELWVHNGEPYLTGVHGRNKVFISKGDQIFTADQTRRILQNNPELQDIPGFAGDSNANGSGFLRPSEKKKGGGSGGGKGGKDFDPERYHLITRQLKELERLYDLLSKAKDNAYGTNKLDAIQKEIDMTNNLIQSQQTLLDEIEEYRQEDLQKLKDLKVDFELDDFGNILNWDELQDEYAEKAQNGDESAKKIWDAIQKYEETIDKMHEAQSQMQDYIYQLAELSLEKIKTEVELVIKVDERELKYIDYQISKLENKIYDAAAAIGLVGEKMDKMQEKVKTTTNGLEKLFKELRDEYGRELTEKFDLSKMISIGDLEDPQKIFEKLDPLHINGKFGETMEGFVDNLISYLSEIQKIKYEQVDKLDDAFKEMNENISKSIDLFDHYNNILSTTKNIVELTGNTLSKEIRDLNKQLDQSMLQNTLNQLETEQANQARLQAAVNELQQQYDDTQSDDWKARWKQSLEMAEEELRKSNESILSLIENSLEQARNMFETTIDNIVSDYEQVVSGMFVNLNYFQDAFDRNKKLDEFYVDDYEKYYQIAKLQRSITADIDKAARSGNKQNQGMKKLYDDLNKARESGVELSSYDLDIFAKRYEYEKALMELEDARNNKSEVRLQRSANGTWGYVYTSGADEDDLTSKQQAVEDKIYELNKAAAERFKQMQDDLVSHTASIMSGIADILKDTTLSAEQQEALINERFGKDLQMLEEESKALETARNNMGEFLDLGSNAWQAVLTPTDDLLQLTSNSEDFVATVRDSLTEGVDASLSTLREYEDLVDNLSGDFINNIPELIDNINEASEKTQKETTDTIDDYANEFQNIMKKASMAEQEFIGRFGQLIADTEHTIESLQNIIRVLNTMTDIVDGDEYEELPTPPQTSNEDTGGGGSGGGSGGSTGTPSCNPCTSQCGSTVCKNTCTGGCVKECTGGCIGTCKDRCGSGCSSDCSGNCGNNISRQDGMVRPKSLGGGSSKRVAAIMASGGFTGDWGSSEGRWAILHEKEQVFNKDDTEKLLNAAQILRTIDIQADIFGKGLSGISIPQLLSQAQELEQNVHIDATFPNVTDHNEIEMAFDNLINKASQYANRKNMSSMTFQDMYTSKF